MYQKYIFLVYEKLETPNVEKDNFKIGCCPKAGNFFRIQNNIEEVTDQLIETLKEFQKDNNDEASSDKIDEVIELLEGLDFGGENRKSLGK